MCIDRPPLPLPDRDPGFGQIPTKPVDTALIRAARSADIESLRLLVEAGADPKLRESDGFNAVLAVTAGPEIPPLVDRRPRAAGRARRDRGADVPARASASTSTRPTVSASRRCTRQRSADTSTCCATRRPRRGSECRGSRRQHAARLRARPLARDVRPAAGKRRGRGRAARARCARRHARHASGRGGDGSPMTLSLARTRRARRALARHCSLAGACAVSPEELAAEQQRRDRALLHRVPRRRRAGSRARARERRSAAPGRECRRVGEGDPQARPRPHAAAGRPAARRGRRPRASSATSKGSSTPPRRRRRNRGASRCIA